MKQILIGSGFLLLCAVISLILLELSGHQIRKEELRSALNRAMKQTMHSYVEESDRDGYGEEEFKQDFLDHFLVQLTSDGDVSVCFYTADAQNGFLDVEVCGEYKSVTGKERMIRVRKTMICE